MILLAVSLLTFAGLVSQPANAQWVQCKGPYGGNVLALAIRGTVQYAGTQSGDVFRSTDGGGSWSKIMSELQNSNTMYHINAIAISHDGTVFVGTTNDAAYRSTDNGQNWTHLNTPVATIQCIAINSRGMIFAGSVNGVLRSTDNGDDWDNIGTVTGGGVIVNTPRIAVSPGDVIMAGTTTGLYRSTDDGLHWTLANDSALYQTTSGLAYKPDGSLFNVVYGAGVFRSTNDGTIWTMISDNTEAFALCVDSAHSVYAGTYSGIIRSTDNGITWSSASSGIAFPVVSCLATDSAGTVYAGIFRGGGVFRSTDNGGSWTERNTGLFEPWISALTVTQTGQIFTGTYSCGAFASTDGGDTWSSITDRANNFQSDVMAMAVDSSGNLLDYCGQGLMRSTDGGVTWNGIFYGGNSFPPTNCIAVNKNGWIFAGTNGRGAYRSTDSGSTWEQVMPLDSTRWVNGFAFSSTGTIFAATDSFIYRSTDNGAGWTQLLTGLIEPWIAAVVCGSGAEIFAGSNADLYRSTDNGEHWTALNCGLGEILSIAVTPDAVFASVYGGDGIYCSRDSGATWLGEGTGLPGARLFTSLAILDSTLYAASRHDGLWKRPVSEMITSVGGSSNIPPSAFRLEQNYPNPFNPSTGIRFTLKVADRVRLFVYDILGQKVRTLADQEMMAGSHVAIWDGRDDRGNQLSSGIYFYRLQAGNPSASSGRGFTDIKKMLMIK
jgi:photosystem II stability/assembly factor-like uncharacterized protein